MPTPYEYLQQMTEPLPDWLENFQDGDAFPLEQFFASRVVYYPGSGDDGHPVKLFGSTHCAHTFVYVDYGIPQDFLEERLSQQENGFKGYTTLSRLNLSESDLVSGRWTPHIDRADYSPNMYSFAKAPFGFLEILQRDSGLGDDHGPRRLAILFLGADGIATYDALFCQEHSISEPFAVVVQDHGFGGNYNRFGQGGILEGIASSCHVLPQLQLVAEDSDCWAGFEQVPDIDGDFGGMHCNRRFLHRQSV